MPRQINEVTRTRLWYVVAFLIMDAAVVLGLEQYGYIPTTSPYALPLFIVGVVSVLLAACVGSVLIVTKERPVELRAQRQRE
jgi:ABC-type thiamin/hydroxymethylpyrimidine transport system permease subunit